MQSTLPIGTMIREQYVVVSVLGDSSSGTIYLVREKLSKRLFVLKEISQPDWTDRYQFAFESMIYKRLDHPALAHIYDMFNDTEHERTFMLIEHIEGRDLDRVRQKMPEKLFPLFQALTLMAPIVDAVIYLHNQHPPLIHQHIKPVNIIVSRKGNGTILVNPGPTKQPGIAPAGTPTDAGTIGYRAPEQYRREVDPRTDMYALGATFYTLLTGRIPVDVSHRLLLLNNQLPDPLLPVNGINPAIPPAVALTIHRAMALRDFDCFPSVEQFWQALRADSHVQQPEISLSEYKLSSRRTTIEQILEPEKDEAPTDPALPRVGKIAGQKQPEVEVAPLFAQSPAQQTLEIASAPITDPRVPQAPQTPVPPTTSPSPAISLSKARRPAISALHDQPLVHHFKEFRAPFFIVLFITLLIILGVGANFWFYTAHQTNISPVTIRVTSHATVSPTSQATSITFPTLAGSYTGTLHDIPTNTTTKMSLSGIQQQQRTIDGSFSGMNKNGFFKGTITSAKHILFTVISSEGEAIFSFDGLLLPDGSIGGSFCSLNSAGQCGNYGVWSVIPTLK